MRDVVIKTGVYGRRDEKGRVLPVAKGERVTLSDEEAARLVDLDVASYVEPPVKAPTVPPAPPSGGEGPPAPSQDTPGEEPPAEPPVSGGEGDPDAAEVARLERMQRPDLEQMAADLGVDSAAIFGAKNKHDLAVLIVAAGEPEDGGTPPDLGAGDIVQ